MTKAKISEYDAVAANNTDVNGVNIAENCPPSGMNNMGREIMAALKRFQTGSDSDGVTVGGNLVVSGTSTLSTTSISSADINAGTIDGTAIGGASAAAGSFTTLNTSGAVVFNDAGADVDFRVEGDTDANLLFVDASTDRVGIGTNTPSGLFDVASRGITAGSLPVGSVLQVVNADYTTSNSTTSTAYVIGVTGSITTVSASSKIQILATFGWNTASANSLIKYERTIGGSTTGLYTSSSWVLRNNDDDLVDMIVPVNFLDAPSQVAGTTITYTISVNRGSGTGTIITNESYTARIQLMEIAA